MQSQDFGDNLILNYSFISKCSAFNHTRHPLFFSPSVHLHPLDCDGRVLLPGGGAAVLPDLRLLPARPQALAGVGHHSPHHPQPPQLQGQHHAKEREVHPHGIQGVREREWERVRERERAAVTQIKIIKVLILRLFTPRNCHSRAQSECWRFARP